MSTTTEGRQHVVFRGVQEICGFVGINPKRFTHYRTKFGLPVFKTDVESKVWLATYKDLVGWVEERKSAYFNGAGDDRK